MIKIDVFLCNIDSLGVLGAPASRRLGLAMAAGKTKESD
jgi:hypothetical protein